MVINHGSIGIYLFLLRNITKKNKHMSKNNEKTVFVVRIDSLTTTFTKKHWWNLHKGWTTPDFAGTACIAVCDTKDKCYEIIQEYISKYKDNMKDLGVVLYTPQKDIDWLINGKSTQIPVTWTDTRNGVNKRITHYYGIHEVLKYD